MQNVKKCKNVKCKNPNLDQLGVTNRKRCTQTLVILSAQTH